MISMTKVDTTIVTIITDCEAEDSGLRGPGFHPCPAMLHCKIISLFSNGCFGAYGIPLKVLADCPQTCNNK